MKKLIITFIFVMLFIPISTYAWDSIGYYAQYSGVETATNKPYDSDNCETSGRFSYTRYDDPGVSSILWYRGVSPTDYSGYAARELDFTFRRDLEANKFYDIRIRFNGKDVRPYVDANSIFIYTGTQQCRVPSSYQSDLVMISFTNKATTESNSDYIQIRLYASVPISNWRINISPARQSTSTNWGVKDIIFNVVDMSGNNAIIENNTVNSQNIINNNNQNTQDIINNNNQNTQQLIDSQQNCFNINKSSIIINKYLGSTGILYDSNSYGITDFININNAKVKLLTPDPNNYSIYTCFYREDKTLISCFKNNELVTDIVPPNNSYYLRTSINKNADYPIFQICKNSSNALNDSLTSDSIPTGNDFLDELNDMLPTDNTISSLITLPLSLYSKVLDSINGTCSSISLGRLYNTDLVMPCIDISSYVGNNIWSLIDAIISGGFVIIIAKKMVKAFHSFSELKEGDVIGND